MPEHNLKAKIAQTCNDFQNIPGGLHFVVVKNTEHGKDNKNAPMYVVRMIGTENEVDDYIAKNGKDWKGKYSVENAKEFEKLCKSIGVKKNNEGKVVLDNGYAQETMLMLYASGRENINLAKNYK